MQNNTFNKINAFKSGFFEKSTYANASLALIFLRSTITAILMLFTCTAIADEVRLAKEQLFVSVRQRLITEGWRPKTVGGNERIGIERMLANKGIIENESCSVDGKGYCIFNYKRKHQCLQLLTVGEVFKSMYVTNWHFGCGATDLR